MLASLALALVLLMFPGPLLGGTPAPGLPPSSPPSGPTIATLVVLAPGIDPNQSATPVDAYQRGADAFSARGLGHAAIIEGLHCAAAPAAGQPFVACADGIAWIPYSYAGVAGGRVAPYSGRDTGQSLERSAAALDAVVSFARGFPAARAARLVVVGHGLGGAIASYWGATHADARIITLDSPVNGIWPTNDRATLRVYCDHSVGLIRPGSVQQRACGLLALLPGFKAPVIPTLQDPAYAATIGKADAHNYANTADVFVPSWHAVNPAARGGGTLLTSACALANDPGRLYHECVVIAAAPQVVREIQPGTPPPPSPIRFRITLHVSVANAAGTPASASLTFSHAGQVIVTVAPRGGQATVAVPWEDVLVETTSGGRTLAAAALPATNQDLSLVLN